MGANAGAIRAGRAFIELFADESKLNKGLAGALGHLRAFSTQAHAIGNKLSLWGSGLLTALGGVAKVAADAGSHIADLAKQTGLSAEAASGLKYAAEQSATSLDDLAKGIGKMQRTIVEARDGSKSAAAALDDVGLSIEDLNGLSPDAQFKRIADGIAAIEDPAEKTAAAMAIFGKAGAGLLPLLEEGSVGIDAMIGKARDMNLIMSADQAKAAEEFGDLLDTVKGQMTALAVAAGKELIPSLTELVKWLSPLLRDGTEWIRQNGELIVMLGKVGFSLVGAGAALKTFAMAAGVAATASKLLKAAMALTPWGAVAVAVGEVGAAYLTLRDNARAAREEIAAAIDDALRIDRDLNRHMADLLKQHNAGKQPPRIGSEEWNAEADATRQFWAEQDARALFNSIAPQQQMEQLKGLIGQVGQIASGFNWSAARGVSVPNPQTGEFETIWDDAAGAWRDRPKDPGRTSVGALLSGAKSVFEDLTSSKGMGKLLGGVGGLGRTLQGAFGAIAESLAVPSRGTFSSFAAERALGSTNLDQRIADATEGTEREVEKLRRELADLWRFDA